MVRIILTIRESSSKATEVREVLLFSSFSEHKTQKNTQQNKSQFVNSTHPNLLPSKEVWIKPLSRIWVPTSDTNSDTPIQWISLKSRFPWSIIHILSSFELSWWQSTSIHQQICSAISVMMRSPPQRANTCVYVHSVYIWTYLLKTDKWFLPSHSEACR